MMKKDYINKKCKECGIPLRGKFADYLSKCPLCGGELDNFPE